jgi:hypothetical protein
MAAPIAVAADIADIVFSFIINSGFIAFGLSDNDLGWARSINSWQGLSAT